MLLFQTEHQFCVHKVPCQATESHYIILRSVCGVLEVQLGLLHPFFCWHHIFRITRKPMPLIGQLVISCHRTQQYIWLFLFQ